MGDLSLDSTEGHPWTQRYPVTMFRPVSDPIIGNIWFSGSVPYLDTDNHELPDSLPILAKQGDPHPEDGDVVEALLVHPRKGAPRAAQPTARVLKILGPRASAHGELARVIRSRGLPGEFPRAALAEADALPDEPAAGEVGRRLDLREVPFVTIDGADAKDFDDAVAVSRGPADDSWTLYVAIADVSHYVQEGSALDAEALSRATSIYLPGRCIPMLPERLSNNLCSLRPDTDRLAMAATMEIGPAGDTLGVKLAPAIIRSRARLTYAQAQAAIDDQRVAAGPAWEHRRHIRDMGALATKLAKRRTKQGALELSTTEPEVIFDPSSGEVETVRPRPRQPAHRLIEQLMLTANSAVGAHLTKLGLPAIFRVHPSPDPERIATLVAAAAALGFDPPAVPGGGAPPPSVLAAFLARVADEPAGPALHQLALRCLAKAVYAVDDIGHYGLATKGYLHFTSPIRRYPDLVVHRLIRATKRRKKRIDKEALEGSLQEIAEHSSAMERRAMEAEFEALDLFRCLAVIDRVGDELDATVATVVPFGLFLQVADPFVEGLLHISDLGEDYYEFDERRLELRGRRTSGRFRVGDQMRIKIDRVDLRKRQISFLRAEVE
jgi:ribonuclease R